jgi:hypothetical protein
VLPTVVREPAILPRGCHPERSEGPRSWRERVVAREVLRSAQDDDAFFRTGCGWRALALHDHPAIDGQDLAGNVFCLRCGEEGDRGGDVFTFAEFT